MSELSSFEGCRSLEFADPLPGRIWESIHPHPDVNYATGEVSDQALRGVLRDRELAERASAALAELCAEARRIIDDAPNPQEAISGGEYPARLSLWIDDGQWRYVLECSDYAGNDQRYVWRLGQSSMDYGGGAEEALEQLRIAFASTELPRKDGRLRRLLGKRAVGHSSTTRV